MVAPRLYCSVEEAVEITGLSASTVRRRIRDGSLPTLQPGGKGTAVLVPIDALTNRTRPQPPEDATSPADDAADP